MQTTYKVGDKVRILNAKKIMSGGRKWDDGDITTVDSLWSDGDPRLVITRGPEKGKAFVVDSSEFEYIEKVEESDAKMTQFKVGDKVRVIGVGAAGLPIGTEAKVTQVDWDGDVYLDIKNVHGNKAFYLASNIELVSPKQTKNQRLTSAEQAISTLEQKVEAMQAEIDLLKAAQKVTIGAPEILAKSEADIAKIAERFTKMFAKEKKLTPNEQRKAIIDEAKAFVENYSGIVKDNTTPYTTMAGDTTIKLFVNKEKRIVTAIPHLIHTNYTYHNDKKFAKCAPGDVFNADIGKAIALGRALGLDVERFEKAVQPTEFAVGQIALCGRGKPYTITGVREDRGMTNPGTFHWKSELRCGIVKITNDTEAQY